MPEPQPAPYEVREAARYAYINHEGYGRVEGFNAAADLAYAAGIAEGRRRAAEAIRNAGGAYPDVLRQCANLADHGDVDETP